MDLWNLAIALLVGGVAVMVATRLVPGVYLRGGFLSAVLVGAVYGLLKMLLQKILILLSLPVVIVTLGAFIFVINAFLLWLTDKLMDRFEIRSTMSLLAATLVLSVVDLAFAMVLRGALF